MYESKNKINNTKIRSEITHQGITAAAAQSIAIFPDHQNSLGRFNMQTSNVELFS